MSRTIVSISVPIGSVSYDIINKWRNNGRNISDLICKAISSSGAEQAHIEGCKIRIAYLENIISQYEAACERAGVALVPSKNKSAYYSKLVNDKGQVLVMGRFST
jgi:hypothetical protein